MKRIISIVGAFFFSVAMSYATAPSWLSQQSGGDLKLGEVAAISSKGSNGYCAVQKDGLVLLSENGHDWTKKVETTATAMTCLDFYDANHGVAAGNGVLIYTTNGGEDWNELSSSIKFKAVDMTSSNRAVLVGDNGKITIWTGSAFESPQNDVTTSNLTSVSFYGRTGFACGADGTLLKSEDGGSTWEKLEWTENEKTISWASATDPSEQNVNVDLTAIYTVDTRTVYAVGKNGVMLKTVDGGASWSRRETGTTDNLNGITRKADGEIMVYGENGALLTVNDKTDLYSIRYFYDKLGRIVASQNSRQAAMMPPRYSYTLYDALGRNIEAGELVSNAAPTETMINATEGTRFPDNWSLDRYQVTHSFYDRPEFDAVKSTFDGGKQENLRGRIASVVYQDVYDKTFANYNHATHYSYDIHGNVKEMFQEDRSLVALNQQYKHLRYHYDLVSGKVTQLDYQTGAPDQFFHRYQYDADNRIVEVQTSRDSLHWYADANYDYYRHGPLARTVLGNGIQGLDYAYTLQGWIKGMNSDVLGANNDMGADGSANNNVCADAAGYTLRYNAGDYKPIGGNSNFKTSVDNATEANGANNLYNGNISAMSTALAMKQTDAGDQVGGTLTRAFQYDELNRLKSSNAVGVPNASKYATTYSYDANGNILGLTRNDAVGSGFDDLSYHYEVDADGNFINNRLQHVNDESNGDIATDIKNQGTYTQNIASSHNYAYDPQGNLIKDKAEQIAEIEWTATGKVKAIRRTESCTDKHDLSFTYDALGNRVSKTVYPLKGSKDPTITTTHYVRDAQGNILSVYTEKKYSTGVDTIFLSEQYLYGSSRLGVLRPNLKLAANDKNYTMDSVYSHTLGQKNYELINHLGNVLAVVSDEKQSAIAAEVLSVSDYYPFGMEMPGRKFEKYASEEYRFGFTGHEKESDMAEGIYTTEYRLLDSRVGRWLSVDPLYGKYPGLSPYNYCEGNPILMLDPDGRKIKVADNVYGAAENLAKIAATNLGSQIIDHLIQKHQTYILNSVIFTLSSVYDPKSHEINYVADPWMTNVDDASITSMIAMGHEMFHAFDHAKNVYNEKNAGYSVGIEEPRAVSFANYLREVYSLRPLRSKYGNIKGDFYQFQGYAHNERITDFKILGNNEDETSFGFSYTKTITEGYYKTVGYGVLAHDEFQKTGETKTECFMIVSLDKDNNASYKTYKNKKEYADATKTW